MRVQCALVEARHRRQRLGGRALRPCAVQRLFRRVRGRSAVAHVTLNRQRQRTWLCTCPVTGLHLAAVGARLLQGPLPRLSCCSLRGVMPPPTARIMRSVR